MSAPKMSAVALALGVAVLAASPASAREKIAEIDGLAEQKPAASSVAVAVDPIAVAKVAEVSALKEETLSVQAYAVASVSELKESSETVGTNAVAETKAIAADKTAPLPVVVSDVKLASSVLQIEAAKLKDVKAAKEADPALDAINRFEMFRPGCMTRAWAVQQMGISADKRGDSAEADRLFDRYMGMMEGAE